MSKEGLQAISREQLTDLQCTLRELDTKWVQHLVDQINADDKISGTQLSYQKEISVRKIYNVFNGIVRDNGWKIFIYGQAKKLMKELSTQLRKVSQ